MGSGVRISLWYECVGSKHILIEKCSARSYTAFKVGTAWWGTDIERKEGIYVDNGCVMHQHFNAPEMSEEVQSISTDLNHHRRYIA